MNVYKSCPSVENSRFLLRLVREEDCADLLKVYSDTAAVPLFNSDNCNGDDFYYTTLERMLQGIGMWLWSYEHGWFVRWSIIDKSSERAIGTIELFRRPSEDSYNGCGVLRLDLSSTFEQERDILDILPLILAPGLQWFGCHRIITKAKPIAEQRIKALKKLGFTPGTEPLIGHDGTRYWDYFVWQP